MDISCVIVTHNSSKRIKTLIDSLVNQSLQPSSIIIVDNCSNDKTVSIIESHAAYPELLSIYKSTSNTGGAGGFRTGLDIASRNNPDYIITFDDDAVILDKEYLKKLIFFMSSNSLDISSSLVVDLNNHNYTSFKYKLNNVRTNDIKSLISDSAPIKDIKFFNGSIFTIEALRELKGPRPEFFIRGDEQEFRLRVLSSKFKVGVCKDAVIYHPSVENEEVIFQGHTLVIIDHKGKQYFSTRNRYFLYSRFYGHNHNLLKMARIIFKSFYIYCLFYLKRKDYLGLYIWLRAFIDGITGKLNSGYSDKIKQKYFN